MNKDINIILNSTDVVAAAFDVADGVVSIDDYSFQWKKIQKVSKDAAVTAATGAITLTPSAPSAGTEYRVIVNQFVADEEKVVSIGYVAVAGDTATTVCNNLRTLINAFVSAGSLDVVASGTTTCIITSTTTNPLISVGGLLELTASAATAGTAGVNEGATLLSEGVADSFDSDLPQSGLEYTLYDWELMLPKGYGGFNHQSDDQLVHLKLYIDEAGTAFAALQTEIDNVLAGLNPSGTGSDELLGQD